MLSLDFLTIQSVLENERLFPTLKDREKTVIC
ncbi:uncharacterized protein METZ01_LOCUS158721 [marine metagenome]|uniref:Uncharacterized protein n=1 Tax=marine metagenome TaxID=408172 RepID=A0A382AY02_9ZZZZ